VTSARPTKYALGSVLNHVLLHQTVIGSSRSASSTWPASTRTSWWAASGAAATFAGFAYPFLANKLTGKAKGLRVVAIEPAPRRA